jgi:dihydroorotase
MSRYGSLTDPPVTLLIRGARIVDPGAGTDAVGDLAILEGVLVEASQLPGNAETLDGRGLIVAPGFCDLHVHLREPGAEGSETIASGARAAAHGGFTTICAMPNTDPPLDTPDRMRWVLDRGKDPACRVRVVAAATLDRGGERATPIEELAGLGIAGVSDDGAAVAAESAVRDLLTRLAAKGLPLIEHAEDAGLAADTLMRAGPTATRLALSPWPAEAELSVVERDIALAAATGGWVHFTHLSTAGAVAAVRRARADGVRVTCDVTPHHFALTDTWVGGSRQFAWEEVSGFAADPFRAPLDPSQAYDPSCRVNPPLPSRADALALLAALADGTIDAIATDHAPHAAERKAVAFGRAAPGMIGLETALSLGLAGVAAGRLSLSRLIEALSIAPASLMQERRGLGNGAIADLVVFEPEASWVVSEEALASASSNTPLLGMRLPGVVRLTLAEGRVTYRDGLDTRG